MSEPPNVINMDSKKRRAFVALHFAAGNGERWHIHQRARMICRLFTMLLLFPICAFANGYVFEDKQCDFNVTFPVRFQTKEIYKGSDVGVLATARPNQSVRLSAECWPREDMLIRDYVNYIQNGVQKQGIEVIGITSERSRIGDVVILSGRTNIQGKALHLRLVSYFGPKYRLDLRVLDYNPAGSKEQIDFRNSVKLK